MSPPGSADPGFGRSRPLERTVIKSLGKLFQKVDCISGATIMGNGNVALILDLAGIIRSAKLDEAIAIARNAQARRYIPA